MPFTEKSFLGINSKGYHRIVYNDWGPENAVPIICVHGLTGNGHDFDILAQELINDGRRLICVDLPGRGRSDFLPEPFDYNYRQYCSDLTALLAHLGINQPNSVDWIGISLGGLLGIRMAGMKDTPIRRMILNDVGPIVPQAALDFIHMVISQEYSFPTIADLEKRMRETRGLTWGPVTDAQWKLMAEHNARALENGLITYSYDPDISVIFGEQPTGEQDLWPAWDAVKCPVMVIHGKKSVVLTKPIISEMQARFKGASLQVIQYADCGHVPSLMAPQHVKDIRTWLNETQI
ncbi:MAG: alpha/beta hydrolase [Alphaproteobacteria bacterium]